MLVKILKPFHHSEDGVNSRLLRPSADPDHREEVGDDLCAGLSGEGYIDGAEHGLPLLSEKRRSDLIERIVAAGRIELAKVPDADLIAAVARYEARAAELAGEGSAEEPEEEQEVEEVALLGSSVLPAHVVIGDVTVQLGGLVVAAARMSNHDAASWNDLSEEDRDAHLQKAVEVLSSDPALLAAEIDASAIVPKAPDEETNDDAAEAAADAPTPPTGAPGAAEGPATVETVAEPAAEAPKPAAKPRAKKAPKRAAKA